MNITYYFGKDEDAFVYDADIDEFVDSLSYRQLCDAAYDFWEEGKVEDALMNTLKGEWPELNLPDGFKGDISADLLECAQYIFENQTPESIYDMFEDDIKAYFEEEAEEEYEDYTEFSRDPLGYYGMSESDFI